MKKFYALVSHKHEEAGYSILLDGRPVKTAAKNVLLAPNEDIANAVVAEWAGQEEEILPDTMPLTQILNTKIDRITGARANLTPELLKFFNTDLLCYPAPGPEKLVVHQNALWSPWRDWFAGKFGKSLETTTGLGALTHPPELHDKIKDEVEAMNDDRFTIFQIATPLAGSIVLGLAFTQGAASADDLMKAAFTEEDFKSELYNEEQYGPDPLTEKKRVASRRDLEAAEFYLKNL